MIVRGSVLHERWQNHQQRSSGANSLIFVGSGTISDAPAFSKVQIYKCHFRHRQTNRLLPFQIETKISHLHACAYLVWAKRQDLALELGDFDKQAQNSSNPRLCRVSALQMTS